MREDGLKIAADLYVVELADRKLSIDLKQRILPTPYCGTFCFPRGYSAEDCESVILAGMKAVDMDKQAYRSKREVDESESAA